MDSLANYKLINLRTLLYTIEQLTLNWILFDFLDQRANMKLTM